MSGFEPTGKEVHRGRIPFSPPLAGGGRGRGHRVERRQPPPPPTPSRKGRGGEKLTLAFSRLPLRSGARITYLRDGQFVLAHGMLVARFAHDAANTISMSSP